MSLVLWYSLKSFFIGMFFASGVGLFFSGETALGMAAVGFVAVYSTYVFLGRT